MTETIEYHNVDKSDWGAGLWQSEPDKRQWQDEVTGLPCLIVRNRMGTLCGYVGVAPEHSLYGKDYDAPEVEIHGGLSYAAGCDGDEQDASRGICHIPAKGEPDHVWWFGFDTAHAFDLCPATRSFAGIVGIGEEYRDLTYVATECASLAAQLTALK